MRSMAKETATRSGRAPAATPGVTPRVLVLHGPNLNLLGEREPHIYGHTTLADIDAELAARGRAAGVEVVTLQSNHEGVLIDRVQQARADADAIIINAGGFTHTSVALRDAIAATKLPGHRSAPVEPRGARGVPPPVVPDGGLRRADRRVRRRELSVGARRRNRYPRCPQELGRRTDLEFETERTLGAMKSAIKSATRDEGQRSQRQDRGEGRRGAPVREPRRARARSSGIDPRDGARAGAHRHRAESVRGRGRSVGPHPRAPSRSAAAAWSRPSPTARRARRSRSRRRRRSRARPSRAPSSPRRSWARSIARRRPRPPAFVEVGDTVRKGQVVCIVEAMKLMNEIEAEADGKVVEILVENGEPVEYGQPLIRLAKLAAAFRPPARPTPCSRRSSSPTAARSRCG